MKISHLAIFIFIVCVMIGCGTAKRTLYSPYTKPSSVQASQPQPQSHSQQPESHSHSTPPAAFAVSKYAEVKVSLEQAYRDWKGTPYVWGGESHNGVDCSGLIQLIFKQFFGVNLPRTTRRQLYTGKFVHRDDLKPGDLVFFDTGRKELHVGVIVSGKDFLNASVSSGVIISSLKDPYWNNHYMTARRVMEF